MDKVSSHIRSKMMSGIRAKNTTPELVVRKILFARGYRFRLHRKDLPGTPDIFLPKLHTAIFVNGCFWHQHENCHFSKIPSSNEEFWAKKLAGNHDRDIKNIRALLDGGFRVLIVWECLVRNRILRDCLDQDLVSWLNGESRFDEFSLNHMAPNFLGIHK